jgi:lysophospholipase L1-like esterase
MFKQLFRNKYTKWIILFLIVSGLVLSDYFLHGYYNTEGYRAEQLEEKKAGECRVACFGGSTTFGFWVEADEAWPAQLNKDLQNKGTYSVVNLGANNQGIYGISYDIKNYEYLNYDMAIIYNGETDRDPRILSDFNFRGDDLFFEAFGYKTILGFYIKEALRRATPVEQKDSVPVFQKEIPAVAMKNKVSAYYSAFDNEAKKMGNKGEFPYQLYIAQLDEVLTYLTDKKIRTVLVCQPGAYPSVQQQKVRQLLQAKYFNKVEYINLSELFPDINKVSFDGMHLTKEGNGLVAAALRDSLFR